MENSQSEHCLHIYNNKSRENDPLEKQITNCGKSAYHSAMVPVARGRMYMHIFKEGKGFSPPDNICLECLKAT